MAGPDDHVDFSGRWKKRPAILVASGPSLTLRQVHRIGRAIPDCIVVAVNDAMYPCAFAQIGYACDRRWWLHHGGVSAFSGLRVRMIASKADREPDPRLLGIKTVGFAGVEGYEPRGGWLRSGGHSGYQALNLAIQALASPIILVGYDCGGPLVGASHFFGEHPDAIRSVTNRGAWAQRYEALAEAAAALGIEVLNATPGSRISCFRKVTLEDTL